VWHDLGVAELPGLDELGGVLRAVQAIERARARGAEVTTLAFDLALGGMLVVTANEGLVEPRVEAQLVARTGQRVHDVGALWPWRGFVGRRLKTWEVVRDRSGDATALQLRFHGTDALVQVGCYGPVLVVATFTPEMPALAPPETGTREAELIAAIRAAPDDDTPRLVWADLAGGERGELVAVQCRLAQAEDPVLRARERDLVERHGDAWAGELRGLARAWEFRRGFIEAIEIDVTTLLTQAGAVVAAAPIVRSLTLVGLARYYVYSEPAAADDPTVLELLDRLFALPELAHFDRLALVGAASHTAQRLHVDVVGHGDAIARRLVSAGVLGRLRALAIVESHLTGEGVRLLATAGLGHLERVWLRDEDGEPPRFL
jgi:uncharacterized protein (TIGR02996 family)